VIAWCRALGEPMAVTFITGNSFCISIWTSASMARLRKLLDPGREQDPIHTVRGAGCARRSVREGRIR
jgi:hypothetical protein